MITAAASAGGALVGAETATAQGHGVGSACERGYGCSYSGTLSFRSASTPMPVESNPRQLFLRLFGQGDTPQERAFMARQTTSLLDMLSGEISALNRKLGQHDQRMLRDYLDSVREIERRDARLRVRINNVLSDRNLEQLPELIRLAGELGVVDVLPMPIDGKRAPRPSAEQIEHFNREIVPVVATIATPRALDRRAEDVARDDRLVALRPHGDHVHGRAEDLLDAAHVLARLGGQIAQVAHALGMKTVAEYVEKPECTALLREFGVDQGQGYYFGKPAPASDLLASASLRKAA